MSATTEEVDKDFRRTPTKRFHGWEQAAQAASEVLLDEMRTLLERHS